LDDEDGASSSLLSEPDPESLSLPLELAGAWLRALLKFSPDLGEKRPIADAFFVFLKFRPPVRAAKTSDIELFYIQALFPSRGPVIGAIVWMAFVLSWKLALVFHDQIPKRLAII
jgi:hypothetical protein